MAAPAQVHLRRVYENPDPAGGRRVLVDRLWPRGLARSAAAVDEWLKAVAPSDELRRWYGHQPEKFAAFRQRYEQELRSAERSGRRRSPSAAGPGGPDHPADRDQGRRAQPGGGPGRVAPEWQ